MHEKIIMQAHFLDICSYRRLCKKKKIMKSGILLDIHYILNKLLHYFRNNKISTVKYSNK